MSLAELQRYVGDHYRHVPFHNYPHGIYVQQRVLELLGYQWGETGERRFVAAGHDMDHGWSVKPNDEERAARLLNWIKDTSESPLEVDEDTVNLLTMATVFPRRPDVARTGSSDERIMADADISNVGASYHFFLSESAKLCIEQNGGADITDDQILTFFQNSIDGFFPFLYSASGEEGQPFISERAKKLWGDAFKVNKDRLIRDLSNDEGRSKLIEIVRHHEVIFFSEDTYTTIFGNK